MVMAVVYRCSRFIRSCEKVVVLSFLSVSRPALFYYCPLKINVIDILLHVRNFSEYVEWMDGVKTELQVYKHPPSIHSQQDSSLNIIQ